MLCAETLPSYIYITDVADQFLKIALNFNPNQNPYCADKLEKEGKVIKKLT